MPREMCTNHTPNECSIRTNAGVAVILHMCTHVPFYREVYSLQLARKILNAHLIAALDKRGRIVVSSDSNVLFYIPVFDLSLKTPMCNVPKMFQHYPKRVAKYEESGLIWVSLTFLTPVVYPLRTGFTQTGKIQPLLIPKVANNFQWFSKTNTMPCQNYWMYLNFGCNQI